MADIIRPVYNEIWASSGEFFSPGSAKISSGWVQELMPYQYENFLQNRNDTSIAYLLQKGVPEWDSGQEYIANKSIVLYSSNLYISTVNNTGVVPTDAVTWRKLTVTIAPNGTVPIASGGTGATTATDARTNLGLGTAATISADSIVLKSITGNAPAADKWTNSITLTLSGGAAGSTSFDGSGNATLNVTGLNASSISSGTVPVSALNNAVLKTSTTGSLVLPSGTTGQRDVSPQEGYTRWNSTTKQKETFNGTAWTLDTSQSEAYLLNRANHTGVQPISSVSGLSSSLDLKVSQTSTAGAAILPSGSESDRPNPSLSTGLLVRGNTDTGKPEWYDRINSIWKEFSAGGELFDYSWHNGPRSTIDIGRVATDGQQLLLLTHPDVCQAIWDGKQHAVDESVWQADPTKRNCWSRGDGTSWVRVPDLNAAVAGTGKPFYLRGGPDSLNGTSVLDAMQGHFHQSYKGIQNSLVSFAAGSNLPRDDSASNPGITKTTTFNFANEAITDGVNGTPRIADETRVKTAYGVMTVRVFTEVSNVGALDAGQLATQLGVVDAKAQELDANTGCVTIYPNGTESVPGLITVNTNVVVPNPFPGYKVFCELEVLYGGQWCGIGMSATSTTTSVGAECKPHNNHASLVVQGGITSLIATTNLHYFSGTRPTSGTVLNLPFRLVVWKLKGGA